MSNLAEALVEEIERNRKLVEIYKRIPTGAFGAAMIQEDIKKATDIIASGDVAQMIIAYNVLKENE